MIFLMLICVRSIYKSLGASGCYVKAEQSSVNTLRRLLIFFPPETFRVFRTSPGRSEPAVAPVLEERWARCLPGPGDLPPPLGGGNEGSAGPRGRRPSLHSGAGRRGRSLPEGPAGAPPAGPEGRRCPPAARLRGMGGCFPPAARCAPRAAPAASGPRPPGPERKALSCPCPLFDSRWSLAGNSSPFLSVLRDLSSPQTYPGHPKSATWSPRA